MVSKPDFYFYQITFGVGTSVTGFQLKSPYNIDPNAEEIFTLPSSHGTPVYATATVENFAGLTTVFRSKKVLVDHTPPVFGIITAKVKAGDPKRNVETVTSANETNVRLEASWNITDDESGVKICFVSVGKSITAKSQISVSLKYFQIVTQIILIYYFCLSSIKQNHAYRYLLKSV